MSEKDFIVGIIQAVPDGDDTEHSRYDDQPIQINFEVPASAFQEYKNRVNRSSSLDYPPGELDDAYDDDY